MKKSISKYSLKLISIALLMSFLYTNLSLCELLITKCKADMTSCCCKNPEKTNPSRESIQKKCCCEIKEMTAQKSENVLFTGNTGLKNISVCTNHCNVFVGIVNSEKFDNSLKVLSFHSPPKKDILILNSNFRI